MADLRALEAALLAGQLKQNERRLQESQQRVEQLERTLSEIEKLEDLFKLRLDPSEDAVLLALSRLSGHNSGHNPEMPRISGQAITPEVLAGKQEGWCARRDSNSRPVAPEATALSS